MRLSALPASLRQRALAQGLDIDKKEDRLVVMLGAALGTAGLLASTYAAYRLVQCWKHRRYLGHLGLGGEDQDNGARIGLAVDMGSSSVRCSAYVLRPTGVSFIPGTLAQVKRDAIGPDGTANAERVVQDVEAVVDGCLRRLRARGLGDFVAVVGFAAFVMNLVGVDQGGQPVTPVLTYADRHPSTGLYVERLRKQVAAKQQQSPSPSQQQQPPQASPDKPHAKTMAGRYYSYYTGSGKRGANRTSSCGGSGAGAGQGSTESMYNTTGVPIHTAYAAPQLCRLAEEESELMGRVFKWQTLASLCLARWTGQTHLPVSYSEASWTGLLDFRALAWCSELVALVPIHPLSLPDLADYHEGPSGADLAGAYAKRWPELRHAQFFLGLGDGACANIGSGCRDAAHLAVTIGTSAAARIVLQDKPGVASVLPVVPPGLWCYRIDRARLLLGGALTDGGSLAKWVQDTFQVGTSVAAAEALAAQLGPDAHGLTVLPFLSGERAPGWNPDAKATITGLTKHSTGVDVYRAGLESVALRLGAIVRLMGGQLSTDAIVGASGTALECSRLWRQILADVLGIDVVLGNASEATSLGAAVLMAEGLFKTRLTEEGLGPHEKAFHHKPAAKAHVTYQAALERQEALYEALYSSTHQQRIREE